MHPTAKASSVAREEGGAHSGHTLLPEAAGDDDATLRISFHISGSVSVLRIPPPSTPSSGGGGEGTSAAEGKGAGVGGAGNVAAPLTGLASNHTDLHRDFPKVR